MRIAILTPSITTGDAVSNDVLGMYAALRSVGEVRLFAEGSTVKSPRSFAADKVFSFVKNPSDILIYHHSRGWEPAVRLLERLKCRKIIRYHNVTPPEFFLAYNSNLAQICRFGRQQTELIAKSDSNLFLGVSRYNLNELIAAGADERKSFVVPPFHKADYLRVVEPNADVLAQYGNGSTNICTIGRFAPNKGHVDLMAGFAIYHHDYNRDSHLIIVGKHELRLAKYSAMISAVIRRLKLEPAVTFADDVSDNVLTAYYKSSKALAVTSEHEGFCVPLIEAMAMDVPIVAYDSSAISETVGAAGIVWEHRQPELMAESINQIVSSPSVHDALTAAGRRRYQQCFTNDRIAERLLEVLNQM